jgi:hypothetical protein
MPAQQNRRPTATPTGRHLTKFQRRPIPDINLAPQWTCLSEHMRPWRKWHQGKHQIRCSIRQIKSADPRRPALQFPGEPSSRRALPRCIIQFVPSVEGGVISRF